MRRNIREYLRKVKSWKGEKKKKKNSQSIVNPLIHHIRNFRIELFFFFFFFFNSKLSITILLFFFFFPYPEMAGTNIPCRTQTVRTVAPSGRRNHFRIHAYCGAPSAQAEASPGRVFIQGTAVHYPHDNIGWWELLVSRDTHHLICGPSLANFYDNSTIPRHCRFLPRAETARIGRNTPFKKYEK